MKKIHSCIYEGEVRHRRHLPIRHDFRYRMFMLFVDLAELPHLFRRNWLWSAQGPNLAWFCRADHIGLPSQSLSESIRELVESETGSRPSGPIRLLTHFRYFGYVINPISLYYCFDRDQQVQFVVAEVTNTPWRQRHCYVLDVRGQQSSRFESSVCKELHVSPFMSMDYDYQFQLTAPGESLLVRLENHQRTDPGRQMFDATLSLRRRPMTSYFLARTLIRYPLMTARISWAIYWQALRLRLKGAPFHPHPDKLNRIEPNEREKQESYNVFGSTIVDKNEFEMEKANR